jgi:hypothetical protein
MLYHLIKSSIDADFPVFMQLHPLPQRAVEAEMRNLQDHSWVRAPPQHGLPLAKPRKAAFAVSFPKTFHRESAACSE